MRTFKVRSYNDAKRPALKWVVNFQEDGKRARKFFEIKREAETFARLREVELENQGNEGAQFPTALRVMATEANEKLEPYGKTIMDAVEFYLPHLEAMNRTCTVSEMVAELVESKWQDGASVRYLQDLRSRLGQFASSFEDKTASEITGADVDGWLRSLHVSPTTRNNFRRVLVVAFNFAVKRGYCASNPAVETAKAKEIETAVGILTVDQTAGLLSACDVELLPFVAIGAFAGLRRAELERLDWSEIDMEAGQIRVVASKAKSARRRFVKIRKNLDAWIRPLVKRGGAVVPSDFRDRLDTARKAAGIGKWPSNALRHGFASYGLAAENDAAALALELGHTNSNLVFQHYREIVKPKEAVRYWRITPSESASEKVVSLSAA